MKAKINSGKRNTLFVCPECGKRCGSATGLKAHERSKHPTMQTLTAGKTGGTPGIDAGNGPTTKGTAQAQLKMTLTILEARRNAITNRLDEVKPLQDELQLINFQLTKLREAQAGITSKPEAGQGMTSEAPPRAMGAGGLPTREY